MTATRDGLGLRLTVCSDTEVTVEETGPGASCPPVLVLAGRHCVVTLRPPENQNAWNGCAAFLRRLRDHADELAALLEALLEARAERPDRADT
ncbi:hypothetical protein DMA12_26080 [Amycolatopsis balhimycina DSM 5908]|uniref:Uncharacterized protein n=1 Tax=Amycolatopsis balhimycina DSM 5908 TaxID=1081091 RepID=A0A428WC56_AMYBA|nr:hypothetical protein [Amycolatopsis balhimycina]RSM40699.1 hypothetical protein DMA12_26080 [Amycolatopsis balhimycina DSM 5908]